MLTDDALPGTRELLSADAAAVLAPAVEASGGRLRGARPTHVHYRPGRRITVRFAADVTWADGEQRRETLGALITRRGLPEGLAVVQGLTGGRVGVWRYPHDPFLPGLPHAAYPQGARRVLRELGLPAGEVRVTPVVYRPGARAVLRIEASGAELYLKVLRPGHARALSEAHRALGARVPVPHCVGWSDPLGLVVLQALPGRTLARPLVDGDAAPPPPRRVLALLDRIRDVPVTGGSASAEASVNAHARLLAVLVPEMRDVVECVAAAAATAWSAPDRTVHGDFYEAQVLVDDRAVTGLLDVDGARHGSALDDPATFIAHLLALAHVHPRAASRIDAYRRGFAGLMAGRLDLQVVQRAAAGVLLGLATTPFRRQEPDWRSRTHAWLELAANHVDRVRVSA